jgi:phage tail-like protein
MADFFDYKPVSFHFIVGFLSFKMAPDFHFQSVSGLNVNLETETYKEGGENRFVHTLPVRANYSNLILKRGFITDSKVIDWCMDTFNNMDVKPVNLVVSLLNDIHVPVMTWNVVNAFPVKWSVSDFDAEKSALAIETLELKYQYFKLLKL